jgi:hypothetical protein
LYTFFPDGKHLILAAERGCGYFEIRNVATGECVITIRTVEINAHRKLSVSPKGVLIAAHDYSQITVWNVFDRMPICATMMLLLEIDVAVYVVRDIVNMLHATMGEMSASFTSIADFFGKEKFSLIAGVQKSIRLKEK